MPIVGTQAASIGLTIPVYSMIVENLLRAAKSVIAADTDDDRADRGGGQQAGTAAQRRGGTEMAVHQPCQDQPGAEHTGDPEHGNARQ